MRQESQFPNIEDLIPQVRDKNYNFSVIPKAIMHLRNGIKYYYVEIQCKDENFIIHAYGEEAVQLFKRCSHKIYKAVEKNYDFE